LQCFHRLTAGISKKINYPKRFSIHSLKFLFLFEEAAVFLCFIFVLGTLHNDQLIFIIVNLVIVVPVIRH